MGDVRRGIRGLSELRMLCDAPCDAGDTLGGHRDDVEPDLAQPIVTLSLGCDAVGGCSMGCAALHAVLQTLRMMPSGVGTRVCVCVRAPVQAAKAVSTSPALTARCS